MTNDHSERVANRVHMVALYTLYYNFICTQSKLRMMQAGIASAFQSFDAVLARSTEPKPLTSRFI